jgi:2-dehydro-3-deoxyphosphogluconate aldolase/(4S)-4-hydroxy-2-oxoglutarate aldolase
VSQPVLARIRDVGVIPVIRADSARSARELAAVLVDAGLFVIEITMTVPDALAAIQAAVKDLGAGAIVGAGTVTTGEMAARAIDAGAAFVVTPSLAPAVIDAARKRSVPVIAGALTPTEIMTAIDAGADWVKVFPASAVGGPSYLRALKGPFPTLDLVPTGGVTLESVGPYMQAGAAAVGVGGELIRADALKRGDLQSIGALAVQFREAVRSSRLASQKSEVRSQR